MYQGRSLQLIPPRESLATSPIFSNTTGFGGNGDPTAAKSVGDGHCVTEGPFSDLTLAFYNTSEHIHCLSRGFMDGEVEGRLPGDKVKPAAIEEILSQSNYESFFINLEKGPHNQIPNSIKGDFLRFTAPNDPIFFLHHRCRLQTSLMQFNEQTTDHIPIVNWTGSGGRGSRQIRECA
jgi:tyrosinase